MTYKEIKGYCDYHKFYEEVFHKLPDGASMAEIGVFFGHSVAYMASLAKEQGKNITIYAVDTFEGSPEHKNKVGNYFYDQFCENIFKCGVQKYVVPVPMPSLCAAKFETIPDLDFVFIDGAPRLRFSKSRHRSMVSEGKAGRNDRRSRLL